MYAYGELPVFVNWYEELAVLVSSARLIMLAFTSLFKYSSLLLFFAPFGIFSENEI